MLSKLSLRPSKGLYGLLSRNFTNMSDSWYSEEHKAMQTTLKKIIDTEINPYVDQWEDEGQYPAHEVFKKLGDAGLMGKISFKIFLFFRGGRTECAGCAAEHPIFC